MYRVEWVGSLHFLNQRQDN